MSMHSPNFWQTQLLLSLVQAETHRLEKECTQTLSSSEEISKLAKTVELSWSLQEPLEISSW